MTGKKNPTANGYPINAHLVWSDGTPPIQGQIVKITLTGFLVQFASASSHKMGDLCATTFQIPGYDVQFNETMRVVKSYLSYAVGSDGTKSKIQMVEMHFGVLDNSKKKAIELFVQQTTPPPES